jgi:hypothetical protein
MKILDLLLEMYDPEVVKIQRTLKKTGKYNLGKSGPNKDGVDGIYGPRTNRAYKAEYGKPYKTIVTKTKDNSIDQTNVNTESGSWDAILVGGLNYRQGDKSTSEQVSLLKRGLGPKNVKGFDFNTSTSTILNFLKSNSKVPIFLFSAGCKLAGYLSDSPYVNKNRFYIIEPYHSGGETTSSVRKAVGDGVPSNHVFVGSNPSRGSGIVSGTSSSNSNTHWNALISVSGMVR